MIVTLRHHCFHIFDYLVLVYNNDIKINSKKFRFIKQETDFVGLRGNISRNLWFPSASTPY